MARNGKAWIPQAETSRPLPRRFLGARFPAARLLAAAAILVMGALALAFLVPMAGRNPKTLRRFQPSAPAKLTQSSVVLASTPAHDPQAEQLYLKGRVLLG